MEIIIRIAPGNTTIHANATGTGTNTNSGIDNGMNAGMQPSPYSQPSMPLL